MPDTKRWGYSQAARIDEQINTLLETEGMNEDNLKEWMTFARTIRTSVDLIESHIQIMLEGSKKHRRRWDDK